MFLFYLSKKITSMKKAAICVVAVLLTACTTQPDKKDSGNYVPETPKLTSDIMTPEVLWSFGRLAEPSVSPDGKSMAYTVTYYNVPENKSYRDIYLLNITNKESVRITDTKSNESSPQWRPDGKKIGYLTAVSGASQLWEMNPDGSDPIQVTNSDLDINGFSYSPEQSKIFLIKSVKLDNDIHDMFPDLPKANARLETDLMYRHWDSWHDYTYNHIFVASYADGKISNEKDIMEGERFDSPMKPFGGTEEIDWSPDGARLAYTCKKLSGKAYSLSTNSEIYLYDTGSGQTTNLTQGMMGYDKRPRFSPDGSKIAWESMERDGYEADKIRLFVADLKTGEKKDYSTSFDQNSENQCWSADGQSIYFISAFEATEQVYRLNLNDNTITRITSGIHNYTSLDRAGDQLIATKVSMSKPAELYSVDPSSGTETTLTFVNKAILDQLSLGKVEKKWIKTTDNKEMLTWVIYPPKFDPSEKYPALLFCEGGPQNIVDQFWSYRWNFQIMAANGYIITAPNRRGTPGFGQEWLEQISGDYGGQNIQDQLSAIDDLAKEPWVNKDKLGAVGASYGGFAVNYLAGNHKGRFKAFISHCGIFNFEQQYVTTEEMWFENFDMKGPFWDTSNKAAQRSFSFSPHKYVQNWDTPILIITGGNDFRIPFTQGMGAYNAAVLRGVPAEFLFFPDESHWVLKPQNGILWQRVFFRWLDKWLK
jgi:dipeptidyl aminopeptidase/acylaminoacyl peptidase